ncbi:MAG TPA: hypothetical protein VFU98_04630 [Microlunatus sp.]|nr:hypothetical protein [Microlunatus sp.]
MSPEDGRADAGPTVGVDVPEGAGAPPTGLPDVDQALKRLTALDDRSVSEHPDELAAAHETLHRALESPRASHDA